MAQRGFFGAGCVEEEAERRAAPCSTLKEPVTPVKLGITDMLTQTETVEPIVIFTNPSVREDGAVFVIQRPQRGEQAIIRWKRGELVAHWTMGAIKHYGMNHASREMEGLINEVLQMENVNPDQMYLSWKNQQLVPRVIFD